MNKTAVKKWIDALRSGDYKQCRDQLRINDTFCVVGVLCDLHLKETKNEWLQSIGGEYAYNNEAFIEEAPPEVESWIGDEFMERLNSQEIDIMCCNDSGMSFEDLADLIEANAKELSYNE